MLRPDAGGLINSVIRAFGFPEFAQPWLGDPDTALWALIVAAGWGAAGLPLLLCFASVQAIPKIGARGRLHGWRPAGLHHASHHDAAVVARRARGGLHYAAQCAPRVRHHLRPDGGRAGALHGDRRLLHVPGVDDPIQTGLRRGRDGHPSGRGVHRFDSGTSSSARRAPNDHPRPAMDHDRRRRHRLHLGDSDSRRHRHVHPPAGRHHPRLVAPRQSALHADAWISIWSKYPLAIAFWTTFKLATRRRRSRRCC